MCEAGHASQNYRSGVRTSKKRRGQFFDRAWTKRGQEEGRTITRGCVSWSPLLHLEPRYSHASGRFQHRNPALATITTPSGTTHLMHLASHNAHQRPLKDTRAPASCHSVSFIYLHDNDSASIRTFFKDAFRCGNWPFYQKTSIASYWVDGKGGNHSLTEGTVRPPGPVPVPPEGPAL